MRAGKQAMEGQEWPRPSRVKRAGHVVSTRPWTLDDDMPALRLVLVMGLALVLLTRVIVFFWFPISCRRDSFD